MSGTATSQVPRRTLQPEPPRLRAAPTPPHLRAAPAPHGDTASAHHTAEPRLLLPGEPPGPGARWEAAPGTPRPSGPGSRRRLPGSVRASEGGRERGVRGGERAPTSSAGSRPSRRLQAQAVSGQGAWFSAREWARQARRWPAARSAGASVNPLDSIRECPAQIECQSEKRTGELPASPEKARAAGGAAESS